MFKVRFHLAKGKNYRKWQIKDADGTVSFYEPSEVTLYMRNCFLHNNKKTAEKIFGGEDKTVCAWVSCKEVDVVVLPIKNPMNSVNLAYDPRVAPHWRNGEDNIDGTDYDELFTSDRKIFLSKNLVD